MRIGLVSYRCENRDMQFNIGQIERAMKEAQGKADLLCFGEAFLQGFDSLCWNYEKDRYTAVEQSSETIAHLRKLTVRYGLALLTGYIEKEQDRLYSSCIVLAGGEIVHNYRRISGDGRNTPGRIFTTARETTRSLLNCTGKRSCRRCAAICGMLRNGLKRIIS